MDREIRQRLGWVKLYEETGNVGLVCRRCGISRPTLRKWWRRYQAEGEIGLRSRSRRPKHSPNCKVTSEHEDWVMKMRQERLLGDRRIQHELQRQYGFRLATSGSSSASPTSKTADEALRVQGPRRPCPARHHQDR